VIKNKEEQQIVKKRTYGLLPEADTNLNVLQASVESSAQNLVALAMQWEKHRVPLLTQYRDARERNSSIAVSIMIILTVLITTLFKILKSLYYIFFL
jgi:hypothetical protein